MSIQRIDSNAVSYQPVENAAKDENLENASLQNAGGEAKEERDEYIHGDPVGAPAEGIYSEERDDEGNLKIRYIQPGGSAEQATTSTDQVDAEIKKLKQQRQQVQQRLSAEQDEARRAELQSRLRQLDSQLALKDNDMYRRQNALKS